MKHPPIDARGKEIGIGQMVRVIGVPTLEGMSEEGLKMSEPVFKYLVGRLCRVSGFDEYGCAEIEVVIPHGTSKGWHEVWLEPYLLESVGWKKTRITSRSRPTR